MRQSQPSHQKPFTQGSASRQDQQKSRPDGVIMTTHPSAKNEDPTLHCAYFGGPRDGFKTGDLPAPMSGQKLTGMVVKTPLSEPNELSLYAVYECTSETQVDGFWRFEYRGMEGPNGEKMLSASPDPALQGAAVRDDAQLPHEPDGTATRAEVEGAFIGAALDTDDHSFVGLYALARNTYIRIDGQWLRATGPLLSRLSGGKQLVEIDRSAIPMFDTLSAGGILITTDHIAAMSTSGGPASWDTQQNAKLFKGMIKRHPAPPVWESKVRGLMLGLALGDAIGATSRLIPSTGVLVAGAATQLAAWTADGLLRRTTRYGLYAPTAHMSEWGFPISHIEHANQRWVFLRQGPAGDFVPPSYITQYPGWLSTVPAMAEERGHSPSMEAAIRSGVASGANSCRPVIKALPVAAYAGSGRFIRSTAVQAGAFGGQVAKMTHQHPWVVSSAITAVCIAVHCLRESGSFVTALDKALTDTDDPAMRQLLRYAVRLSGERPGDPSALREVAPDDTPRSVLAGGVYVAACYPDWQSANTALAMARLAADGDGVAATVGAFLGALHGYEVFPTGLVSRLELGWVMDRLALDLALEVKQEQVPAGGWKEGGSPWLEPWWDAKYPGM